MTIKMDLEMAYDRQTLKFIKDTQEEIGLPDIYQGGWLTSMHHF